MHMRLTYPSGEEVRKGDLVLFHGEPGEIEFVADRLVGDAALDWYVNELGPGVMVHEPKHFGSAYVRGLENLVFVARSEAPDH